VEAGGEHALDVAENALDQHEVRLTRGMHEEAHNNVLQVRPSQVRYWRAPTILQ
jgi:hypothetical protein